MSNAPINISGLSADEVSARIQNGEVNATQKFTTRTIPDILKNNIFTVFNTIITVSVIALVLIHAYIDSLFLLAVAFFNTLLSIIEEIRAKIALDRLALLKHNRVKVIRSGFVEEIPVENVVKDEVICFERGDQIIADGILISTSPVAIDESLLTGEARASEKHQHDKLLSGSFCVAGSGIYVATAVGSKAYINTLAAQAKSYKSNKTPLQRDINILIEILTVVMVLFSILLLGFNLVKNVSLANNILSIVTVIKSLVPQGLILITTLAFALAAVRIAKKHILVQKLNAIESMSHVTTLCLDKTGTLCSNQLQFVKLYVLDIDRATVETWLRKYIGALKEKNASILTLEKQFPGLASDVIDAIPFSSTTKMSAVRIHESTQDVSLYLGAPEAICEIDKFGYSNVLKELRAKGWRILLFAASREDLSRREGIVPLAFVILQDELRANVVDAIKFYTARNVKIKILSGDHPETIMALAKQAGIIALGGLADGHKLFALSAEELAANIKRAQFMGNLTPEQKQKIIKILQEQGEYVAMVGDGVNDVLALKQAEIGVAMQSGAAASRDVADIILLQDAFTHLPALSYEGDRVIYNIKRIARLFLTKNVYCLFYIMLAMLFGFGFPLSPRYITWIDFLTIGMPITLLTLLTPVISKQTSKHFIAATLKFALFCGFIIASFAALALITFNLGMHKQALMGNTAGMAVIIFMNLFLVYFVAHGEMQNRQYPWQKYLVYLMLAFAVTCNIVIVFIPFLRYIFALALIPLAFWPLLIIISLGGIMLLFLALHLVTGLNNKSSFVRI